MDPVTPAVSAGGRRPALEALRDRLAAEVDAGPSPRDLAALVGRLLETIRELDSLPLAREGSAVDDLASRRTARRADAHPPGDAAERGNGGPGGG